MTAPAASALAAATPTAAHGATAEDGTHLVRALLETAEVRQALNAALPEVLRTWAGESRVRMLVAGAVARVLTRGFSASRNRHGENRFRPSCGSRNRHARSRRSFRG